MFVISNTDIAMGRFCANAYLETLTNWENKKTFKAAAFDLKRMRRLLKSFQNPQKKFFAFHVAGTKGKGSTCAFATYLLRQCGLKTGLYTSPHLSDVKERIRILEPQASQSKRKDSFEGKISQKDFDALALEIHKRAGKEKELTYFEALTCLAFCYFAKKNVDVAVIETGLGGRLDATNTLAEKICALMPIGLEHTEILGKSLQKIAQEKAGILHHATRAVVIGPQERKALATIKTHAKALHLHILEVSKDISCKMHKPRWPCQSFSVKTPTQTYSVLKTRLLGDHQAMNASVAIGMVDFFLRSKNQRLKLDDARQGIWQTRWPGRFEVIQKDPFVILDAAHTKESAQTLSATVQKIFGSQKVILIFGISFQKNKKAICAALRPIVKKVILTQANHPRAYSFSEKEGKELFPGLEVRLARTGRDALKIAVCESHKNDIIVATGSIFLIAEIRKQCAKIA